MELGCNSLEELWHLRIVMANAAQLKALIRSHGDGDDTRFYAIAIQVAATAARSGHGKLAEELRDLVDKAKTRAARSPSQPGAPTLLAQPRACSRASKTRRNLAAVSPMNFVSRPWS